MKKSILLLTILAVVECSVDLKPVHEWKELEFGFPSRQLREQALERGLYQPGNSLPIDVAVDYRANASRIFVTVPRFAKGIPMTLTTVSRHIAAGGPVLLPYPDYSWHSSHGSNCNGLTSVFRVAIDKCDRLWVLDTGAIETTQHCPPQLVVFNLATDKQLMRYRFPADQYKSGISLFITPVVDVQDTSGKCRDTFVYIADVTGQGMVVYDLKHDRSWRINNKLFYPTPAWGTFTILGESFDLMDGLFGMALSPVQVKERRSYGFGTTSLFNHHHGHSHGSNLAPRNLFFHSLASNTENVVDTAVLQNGSVWLENPDDQPRLFKEIGQRNTQAIAQAMDRRGNLFFGMVDPIAVGCWDSSTPYESHNLHVVAQNDETLQFTSGLKIVDNLIDREELWALSCRIQKLYTGTMSNQTVNFRILALQTEGLLGHDGKCSGVNGFTQRIATGGYAPLIFSN